MIEDRCVPEPNTGCHLWTGAMNQHGYGTVKERGRSRLAHRVAWIQAYGAIPKGAGYHGICVLHRCDTPACCNPKHLFLGTQRTNMSDCRAKGRFAPTPNTRGAANGQSRLSASDVRAGRGR